MLTYYIADTIFSFLAIGALVYMYFKVTKLENVYRDLNTIFKQLGDIFIHLDKTDKAYASLTGNLDKIAEVVTSLLLKETTDTKEPEVKAPVKRGRKKKIVE